ncbi:hypothetical protein [Candidatus Poriferisocius sp.]|uniref:hypothetical protein n=1 Tax=Candidatus Poriferisocius sp. TaxID=3101276 RepID=UPI003B01AFE8
MALTSIRTKPPKAAAPWPSWKLWAAGIAAGIAAGGVVALVTVPPYQVFYPPAAALLVATVGRNLIELRLLARSQQPAKTDEQPAAL